MIGNEPIAEDWIVSRGQDLTHLFETTDDSPFPDSTVLDVYALSRTGEETLGVWSAVSVTPGAAQLQIDAVDLDALPDGAQFRVMVKYPGFPRLCWYRGRIWRRD